jgi:hypothetical protein
MNYAELLQITKSVPAWRGTSEYPYAKRTMRQRYFVPKTQANGEIWFHIHDKQELGIMRPDNTFEFTNGLWISNLNTLNWYFIKENLRITQSTNHGGVILHTDGQIITKHHANGNTEHFKINKDMIPVFKGLRINLATKELHENSKYVIHCKTPDRKRMIEHMKPYDEKLNLAKTFLKAMPISAFLDDYMNFVDERYPSPRDYNVAEYEFKGLLHQDPVGAIYSYMHLINAGNIKNWHQRQKDLKNGTAHQWWYGEDASEKTPIYFFDKVKNDFRQKLLLQESAFTHKTFSHEDKTFQSSDWGHIVEVNGRTMDRL